MSYIVAADVSRRVGDSNWSALTDGEDASVVAMLTVGVCDEADGYFRAAGLETPLTEAGAIATVKPTLLDLANFRAQSRGSRTPSPTDQILYDAAIQRLRDIAAGKFVIGAAEAEEAEGQFEIASEEPLMTREELHGW